MSGYNHLTPLSFPRRRESSHIANTLQIKNFSFTISIKSPDARLRGHDNKNYRL